MNKIIIIVIIAIILTGGYFFLYSKEEQDKEEPITIGAVLPMTGIAAVYGENEKNGIDLAVKEINEAGGIAGRKLRIIYEDDQTEPKNTVSAIQKLIAVDKVEIVIGGTWDFLANAAIPVIHENKKVLITPSALPDTLETKSPYVFIMHSPVAIHQSVFENFLSQFDSGKVATIVVNNPWGLAHLETYKKAIAATNNVLIKEIILPQFDNNDIQRELTLIKSLAPDVLLVTMNLSDSAVFARKQAELRIIAKILAHENLANTYYEGNVAGNYLEGITIFKFSAADSAFTARYEEVYGEKPSTYADTAYDAVYVIKQAIENMNGATDAESIRTGLKKITNYKGASGAIDLSVNNFPANKVPVLETFKNGAFVKFEE